MTTSTSTERATSAAVEGRTMIDPPVMNMPGTNKPYDPGAGEIRVLHYSNSCFLPFTFEHARIAHAMPSGRVADLVLVAPIASPHRGHRVSAAVTGGGSACPQLLSTLLHDGHHNSPAANRRSTPARSASR